MLEELFTYCFEAFRAKPYLKRLGLLQELIAIESRAKRCKKAWAHHRSMSKIFMTQQITRAYDKIFVLGAGLLNDIDLDFLQEHSQELVLIDLFFLDHIRKYLKQYPKITLIEMDITQSLEDLVNLYSRKSRSESSERELIQEIRNSLNNLSKLESLKQYFSGNNMLISLNLLSQLALPIEKILDKKFPDENFQECYQNLLRQHLSLLNGVSGLDYLLLTDTEKLVFDRQAQQIAKESSVYGLDIESILGLKIQQEWLWDLSPLGELDDNYALKLKVCAYAKKNS